MEAIESEKNLGSVPWKENVGIKALIFSAVLDTFFVTVSVLDCGIASHTSISEKITETETLSKMRFQAEYTEWRGSAPVISQVTVACLALLPLGLYPMVVSAIQGIFGWRKATRLRNFVDVIQSMAHVAVQIPIIIFEAVPSAQSIIEHCGAQLNVRECKAAMEANYRCQVKLLCVNLVILLLNFGRFMSNKTATKTKTS